MACFFNLKILPGVRVIIVNPETRGPLGDSHLGEVRGYPKQSKCIAFFLLKPTLNQTVFLSRRSG